MSSVSYTHLLNAERQRRHIEQQHVLGGQRSAAQNVGLHSRAQRHYFIGIQIGMRLTVKQFLHQGANFRNADVYKRQV